MLCTHKGNFLQSEIFLIWENFRLHHFENIFDDFWGVSLA